MAAEQFVSAPSGHRTATSLKAEIEMLQAEIARLETLMASHQSEFRVALDCDRVEQLMAELLRMTGGYGINAFSLTAVICESHHLVRPC